MKSTFDIMDLVFKVVNVSAVTTTLDGRVYRTSRPLESVVRDIVVLALPISGGADVDLQGCVMIVNCYAKDLAPGRPDEAHLKPTTAAVIAAIEGYTATSKYLDLEPTSQGVMADMDQSGISYSSIRANCTIQVMT